MGNMLLRGVVHPHGRRIKIMKADGSVMKLRSRVCVKEILIDYPDHEIFEAPSGPPLRIGNFTRPLPERTELVGGHLYYLIPLPHPQDELIDYNNNINGGHFARVSSYDSIRSGSSSLRPKCCADSGRDSIKEQGGGDDDVVNKINRGGVRIVSSSKSTDGSTVRVKVRVRKEELASLLSANNVSMVMENVLVRPLIQHVTKQSALSRWKPRLDTIVEPQSPLGDLYTSWEEPAR